MSAWSGTGIRKRPLHAAVRLTLYCVLLLATMPGRGDELPRRIKFSGILAGIHGSASVVFALYREASGGAPLWQEVQSVTLDAAGHYSVVLGSRDESGIPSNIFRDNEARWLGVTMAGGSEQPRVMLLSVPYAMKAADAETLGGLPASSFLRADAVPASTPTAVTSAAVLPNAISATNPTAGYLPLFGDASGDLVNSAIAQFNGNVGLGTAAPTTLLHLSGVNPTFRIDNYSRTIGDSPNFNFNSARGTVYTPTASQAGDNLGQFAATGHTGAAFPGSKVKITFFTTENWTPTANGAAMTFQTTANGTTARLERMRIDNNGNVGIGTAKPTSPLTVAGDIALTSNGRLLFPDGTVQTSAATAANSNASAVQSVTAADSSIAIGGTATAPTVRIATGGITDAMVHDVSISKVTYAANVWGANTFYRSNVINTGTLYSYALKVIDDNTGLSPNALWASTASNDTNANAIYAIASSGTSSASAVYAVTNGAGVPVVGSATNTSAQVSGVMGLVASTSGIGVHGYAGATNGATTGVMGQTRSSNGVGVMGSAIYQTCTSTSCTAASPGGIGGQFVTSAGGTVLLGQVVDSSFNPTNVFRIDATGKGYFNGGTQVGGADFAELVAVNGAAANYHPGELLAVDPTSERRFRRVAEPYSTLVAGVYATKPGVIATRHTLNETPDNEIPLAVVGIVPCRVTAENGAIHRGDLLVSSSRPGFAMRGTDRARMLGAIVGKALGELASGEGTVEVLVALQ